MILSTQGVTGEQANGQKDMAAMSKAELQGFIQAGKAELIRIRAEREAGIIDVTPSN